MGRGGRVMGRGGYTSPVYAGCLTVAYLLFALVGVEPFAMQGGDTSEGSTLSKVVFLGLLLAAVPVLLDHRRMALRLLRDNWIAGTVLLWMAASVLWADYPGIAVRRVGFVIVGFAVALAIASAGLPVSRMLKLLGGTLAVVLVADVLSLAVVPHLAYEDLGARGMHLSKNMAGAVAMLGIVVFLQLLPLAHGWRDGLLSLGLAALALGFMVLTQSKTSMGLVAIYLVFLVPLAGALAWARGRGASLLLGAGLAVSLALLVVGIEGWSGPDVLEVVFGDRTFTGRTDIWTFVLANIREAPVLGSGYGAFWDVGADNDRLAHAGSWLRQVGLGVINQSHNGYLDLWLQIGLPGMLGGTAMLLRALWLAARGLLHDSEDLRLWAGWGLLFALLAQFLVYNLMESALLSRVHFMNHIFLLAALLAERWSQPDMSPSRARRFAAGPAGTLSSRPLSSGPLSSGPLSDGWSR